MSSSHQTPPPASAESQSPTQRREQGEAASRPRLANPNRRRDKPQLSCNLCRRRKLRCDRQQPSCSSCLLRGQACTYAENQGLAMPPDRTAVPSLHNRIVYLESLVKSLMPNPQAVGNQSNSTIVGMPPPSDPGRVREQVNTSLEDTMMEERSEAGSMRLSASEVRYVGGDHWAAILDSIADLKDHFDQEENLRLANTPDQAQDDSGGDPVGRPPSPHALLLYGAPRANSRAEILAALPPKNAVDRYISRFFNRLDLVASSAVHGPTFVREYEAFWANPAGASSIIWVGLLFSMICLALLASDASDSSRGGEAEQLQINLYREKIVQCLIMGEYTKSAPYGLETLINYVYIEFMMGIDAGKDIWFLLALEVNLAMRMGYHRDPSHFPGISPLQAEMRRRLWATVLLGDTLISSQMGMPCMITSTQYDTAEPRNLNDDDLDENMIELPPPRPETEYTTTLGIIARRRVLVALNHVSGVASSIKAASYTDVMQVDNILRQAIASIPPPLRMKPIAVSVTDTPHVIMARLFLGHLHLKGEIMLHRRFLYVESTSNDEDTFAYSRKACLDAAISSLEIQDLLDRELYSGGLLHTMRFRVGSLMNHHFLTATMILCSLVYRRQTMGRQDEILKALRNTRMIWMRKSSTSREARKAAETINIVLTRATDGTTYDVDPKEEDISTSGKEAQDISNIDPSIAFNDGGMGLDSQGMFRDLGLYSPDAFITPGVLGTFTPPGHPSRSFDFEIGNTGMDGAPENWIMMPGTNW
ncbi:putative fungal-specific transcription factor [Annulohypoxylon maeteangense]|uniref:putative fungal-specific transcription factor n=1 Tax=Annulohypoxylon maeteangense TaxID=1927788 RepID=UPI00200733D5|nr:putative fungal-specific transcription factor [Annulohypoxylon maeteangense]KAI0882950.1 putative fungal-specific transcription factor [Annulohypoxylon maeteangense]